MQKNGLEFERVLFQSIVSDASEDGCFVYLGTLLQRAAKHFFLDTALVEGLRKISYGELYFRALQLSRALKARGLKPRDRVMMFCGNSVEFYIFYFAALQCGAILVPVNTFLGTCELTHIINDCQPKMVLCASRLSSKITDVEVQSKCEAFPDLICEKAIEWDETVPEAYANFPEFEVTTLSLDEVCLILYTSGTTGNPKGVMLSSKNILSNTVQVSARLKRLAGLKERFFAVLPLFHVFAQNACIWIPFLHGATVIVVPKIDRVAIREGLKSCPTIFLGFPALYGLLCLMRNANLDSIKLFVSGADALPDKIRAAFAMIYGRAIHSGYGLTEAAPAIAVSDGNPCERTESVGPLLCGVESQIRDVQGSLVASGSVGTLWVRGDNVMLGYYKDKEHTDNVIRDGWLNTGDFACLSSDGNISICGREKDLIIHKGLNIYPQEIENVLLSHPLVFRVAVVGEKDDAHGQTPVAFVVLKDKTRKIGQALRRFCLDRLAAYKVPKKIRCVEDLPLGATGKVDKKQLKYRQEAL
ncbi:AMP-binding protein [Candidatus Babeliales bacterium]|nr:AMP-binding protein [Candidatus Babeliales bacterium]